MKRVTKLVLGFGAATAVLGAGFFGYAIYSEHQFIKTNGLVRTQTAVDVFDKGCFHTNVFLFAATDVDEAMITQGLEHETEVADAWRHPTLRIDTQLLSRDGGGSDCVVTFLPGFLWPNESEDKIGADFSDYAQARFDRGMTAVDASHLGLESLGPLRAEPKVAAFRDDLYTYYLAFAPLDSGHITFRLVSDPVSQN